MAVGVRTGHFVSVCVRPDSLVIPRGFGVHTKHLESVGVRTGSLLALGVRIEHNVLSGFIPGNLRVQTGHLVAVGVLM